ncbi:hypothetical protein CLORAM_01944 [Thomasclavelia ramosa DSM 1402]|uniref:Uncharacterized protein n=1 Tax=Thomasclavelia ramosa DSM 1402 TaxID=445974 RepID=B0N5N0_9FIRM|nr:hypothetical protein CLORAM_01944 [Thomasclavelia ramosa DSM 1402]
MKSSVASIGKGYPFRKMQAFFVVDKLTSFALFSTFITNQYEVFGNFKGKTATTFLCFISRTRTLKTLKIN